MLSGFSLFFNTTRHVGLMTGIDTMHESDAYKLLIYFSREIMHKSAIQLRRYLIAAYPRSPRAIARLVV